MKCNLRYLYLSVEENLGSVDFRKAEKFKVLKYLYLSVEENLGSVDYRKAENGGGGKEEK